MTSALQQQIARAVLDQTGVSPEPLAVALGHLRTQVPALGLEVSEGHDFTLIWQPRDAIPSEPVGEAFWELVALVDEPDEDFVRFANRFGPLRWPDGIWGDAALPTTQGGVGAPLAQERIRPEVRAGVTYVEPVWAWREYALGLRALFATLEARRYDPDEQRPAPFEALNVVAVPILLRALGEGEVEPSEEDFLTSVRNLQRSGQELVPIDTLLTAALQEAGVAAAFSTDPKLGQPVYSVSATPLRSSSPMGPGELWQVRGLLPVLATSLALVAREPERSVCTWCGKPARILSRRRGQGHWFGDHAACRAVARSEAVQRAGSKRTEKRRRHAVTQRSEADANAGESPSSVVAPSAR